MKLHRKKRGIKKTGIRKRPELVFDLDGGLLSPGLFRHWKNDSTVMSYLNKRYPKPDGVGDFLKAVALKRIGINY